LQAHLIDPADVNTYFIIRIDADKRTRDAEKKKGKGKKGKRRKAKKDAVGETRCTWLGSSRAIHLQSHVGSFGDFLDVFDEDINGREIGACGLKSTV
jgi:hypothetical protein